MDNRYGTHQPPPPPSSLPPRDYGRDMAGPMRSPPPANRYRSPSPRRYRSRSPAPYAPPEGARYRSRSPPRYRSRSPPRNRYRSRSPPPYRRGGSGYDRPARPRAPVYRGTDEERARSTTLFVGNIPYGFEERDVVGLFERFGRLRQVYVPLDRYTHRNKGFAFVEFEQRLDAEDASFKYNGYTIEGRKLRIDWDVGVSRKEHLKPVKPVEGGAAPGSPPRRDYPPRSPRRDYPPERDEYRRERSPGPYDGYRQ